MSYVDTIAWVCTLPVINIGGSLFNYCIVGYLMSRLLRLRSTVVTKVLENCRKVFFFLYTFGCTTVCATIVDSDIACT